MLAVGDRFPRFCLAAVLSSPPAGEVEFEDYARRRLVMFFWSKDFSFVCPTEIAEFGRLHTTPTEAGADLLGASAGDEPVHLAWREQHPDRRDEPLPMASGLHQELRAGLGIRSRDDEVAMRATFIIDPDGVIGCVSVHDVDTARNAEDVLRTVAPQHVPLTACGWRPGDPTLAAA